LPISLVGFHDSIPKSKHGAEIADIIGVVEVMIVGAKFPGDEGHLSPAPIISRMTLAGFHKSEHQPSNDGNIVHRGEFG